MYDDTVRGGARVEDDNATVTPEDTRFSSFSEAVHVAQIEQYIATLYAALIPKDTTFSFVSEVVRAQMFRGRVCV